MTESDKKEMRYTAYVLGELSPREQAEVERELRSSPEARREVEAIRQAAMWLRESLEAEDRPALDDFRRSRLQAAFRESPAPRQVWSLGLVPTAWAAAAVVLVTALLLWLPLRKPSPTPVSMATQQVVGEEKEEVSEAVMPAEPIREDSVAAVQNPRRQTAEARMQSAREVAVEQLESAPPAVSTPMPNLQTEPSADRSREAATAMVETKSAAAVVESGTEPVMKVSVAPVERSMPVSSAALPGPQHVQPMEKSGSTAEGMPERRSLALGMAPAVAGRDAIAPMRSMLVAGEEPGAAEDRPFLPTHFNPMDSFALQIGLDSYVRIRSALSSGVWPPAEQVRPEELVNYFRYSPLHSATGQPLALRLESAESPWNRQNRLVLIRVAAGAGSGVVARNAEIQVAFQSKVVGLYRHLAGPGTGVPRLPGSGYGGVELKAGQEVAALYEIQLVPPVGRDFQERNPQLLTVTLRYRDPVSGSVRELSEALVDRGARFEEASEDLRFASAAAAFGMLLRRSRYMGNASFEMTLEIAQGSLGDDRYDTRREFIELVRKAQALR